MVQKRHFTLLELMAAMGVLSLFIMALMQFFSTSQEVMSLSTDRTGQYERARIAMDMIAKDLQNIYYQEGVATLCYYQQDSGSGENKTTQTLDIAAYRAEKIGNSITNLCRIKYEFADDQLTVCAIGDIDAGRGWNLHNKGDHTVVFPNISNENDKKGVLLEGVKSFAVFPIAVNIGPTYDEDETTIALGGRTVPDMVNIQITLYDSGTLEKLRSLKEATDENGNRLFSDTDPAIEAVKNESTNRVFTRVVAIDRGQ